MGRRLPWTSQLSCRPSRWPTEQSRIENWFIEGNRQLHANILVRWLNPVFVEAAFIVPTMFLIRSPAIISGEGSAGSADQGYLHRRFLQNE